MIIRNPALLMAQIKDNEGAGMERGAVIVEATLHCLRPILLTAADFARHAKAMRGRRAPG